MFYIHHISCISAQKTFSDIDLNIINEPVEKKYKVIEPSIKDIPSSVLRRMGKAVRIGICSAMPLINKVPNIDGIIIGTANGGMEDCIKFLNQIIQYEEGTLTPTNFVQSTANNIAAQTGLMSKNTGYNITHVHRGLAFENAMIDADMIISDNPDKSYILGGVDEISNYNYRISFLEGLYKQEEIKSSELYSSDTNGSVAGEGSAMFVVNGHKTESIACVRGIKTIHTEVISELTEQLTTFISNNLSENETIDFVLSGENGDQRLSEQFFECEKIIGAPMGRFKHLTGEFPTASALSLWFCCHILQTKSVPSNMLKTKQPEKLKNILIYNNYKGYQHSFILVTKNC